jgi:low affinity Fe/Cu permease
MNEWKGVLASLIIAFLMVLGSYGIFYITLYIVFWAFGGTLFGYTFSWKIVLGIYVLFIFYNTYIRR